METQLENNEKAEKESVEKRTYRLTYRYGNRTPSEKFFEFNGDLKAATERAKKHCSALGYIYIYTSPLIVDLDHQENSKKEDPAYEPYSRR